MGFDDDTEDPSTGSALSVSILNPCDGAVMSTPWAMAAIDESRLLTIALPL